MKEILSGNEAIARGAFEAGVKVATAYPGTPSTEILETIIRYKEIDSSWAPNEKVALEVGIGASFGGGRALVAMKHVGVNVAADPLFTLSYTGVNAGLVLITADDPEMHSSQNEQDNRNYAKFAKVPMLEPSDSQECKDFTRLAFQLSEQFDTPVMLRTTTRISHSKSVVVLAEPVQGLLEPKLVRNAAKLVMLPGNARVRHPLVENRIVDLSAYASTSEINRIEMRNTEVGIITSGVPYQYVREVLPDASTLKLGMVHPLPFALIREFAGKVKKLYVVEELDPFIEEQVKAAGVQVTGKELFPICGELTPGILRSKFAGEGIIATPKEGNDESFLESKSLPGRPPSMCPGCPHRGVFYALNQAKAYVTGDIGCYTLGFLAAAPPHRVIGDSTFLHTGIGGLMDMIYNNAPATLMILDNRITAMTGRQDNPASGFTLKNEPAHEVDIAQLCRVLGAKNVRMLDPYDLEATKKALEEEMNRPEPSVIITNRPCVLVKREGVFEKGPQLAVTEDKCAGCRSCLKIGCPAIIWKPGEGKKGTASIDYLLCNGCDVCRQLCKFDAIGEAK